MKEDNRLILISGGTASGKSLISDIVKEQLETKGEEATIIRMDNYYKSLNDLGEEDVNKVNWDKPSVFDWDQLLIDIDILLSGKRIERKKYCYKTGIYGNEKILLTPKKNLIIEGIFIFRNKKLRNKATQLIYVDVDPKIRMQRRMERDSIDRYDESFDEKKFVDRWKKVIQPMHKRYVKKTRKYADEIINNDNEINKEKKLEIIKKIINNK